MYTTGLGAATTMLQSIAPGFAHLFKSEPNRDEKGRFSTKMYRGHGKGSSTTGTLTWVTPDKATAKGYADHRDGGVVSELDVELKNTFDLGRDTRKLTPSKFSVEVLAEAKAQGLVDDKTALALRSEFMKDQGKEEVAIHSLWAEEDGKARVAKLLSGAGFDSVKLSEQGADTYGLLKKRDVVGFSHIFKANPYQDSLGRFTSKDKNVSGASDTEKKLKAKHGVSIASAGSLKDSMAGGAAYGKALKKGEITNSKAWQGTVKDLHDTMDDLLDRLGLDLKSKGIVLLARDSDDTGAAGLAQVGGNTMSFSSALQSRKRVAQDRENNEAFSAANGGRNWGYAEGIISNKPKAVTEKDRAEYAQAVMRHEIGHLLTQPKHVKQFKKAMSDIGANRAWAKDNISVYGASKTIEAMAEAFSMFTDKRYTPGKLPKQVEDVMTNMMNYNKPVKKAEPQGYTPAEFAQDSVGDDDPWDDDIPEVEEAPKKNKS